MLRHADPVMATGWQMIIGGLPLWGISSALESGQLQNIVPSDWLALGYATVFGSAIAYGLFVYFSSHFSKLIDIKENGRVLLNRLLCVVFRPFFTSNSGTLKMEQFKRFTGMTAKQVC